MIVQSFPETADFKVIGRWLRIASPANNYDELADPPAVIQHLKTRRAADLFTFAQKLPHTEPLFSYHLEWDNLAAIPITTYDHWWNKQVEKKVRKHVRRALKAGIVIRQVEFDDTLVRGIMKIYNESPLRGGRPFRHYGDDFATCKRKHATWLDRSEFIGAYLGDELIGFIKLVYAGVTARTIQNIAMLKHGTLAPGNALLARAVEICAPKGITYLIYGRMEYANKGSKGFEEYKRNNGFEMFKLPVYYVPLTRKGKWALRFRLHQGLDRFIPRPAFRVLRGARSWYYERRYGVMTAAQGESVV